VCGQHHIDVETPAVPSYASGISDVPLLGDTIGDNLDRMATAQPAAEAMVEVRIGRRWTYAQLRDDVETVACGLLAAGLDKGDRVGIWAPNVAEWTLVQFATAKIGAVLVTVNTNYKSTELEYVLKQSDSVALFLVQGFKDTDYVETVGEIVPEIREASPGRLLSHRLPFLRDIVFLGEEAPAGMLAYAELERMGEEIGDAELARIKASLHEHEVINMQYTSGTTGFPKGVMLTHHNIVNNGFNIGECMKFTEEDRLCIPVPFFHCFGCVLAVLACVSHASAMVPVETFDPEQVLRTIEAEKCTAVHGVPTMFIAELEHPNFKKYDLSTLRTGIMAGSPCPIEVMKRVISDMHCSEITIAYGQTESSPVITQTRTDDPIELRVPKIFNLRTDPYERADITSNTYYDWMLEHVWLCVPAQAYAAQMLESLTAFPPRQESASFNISKVVEKLQAGVTSA
jgi:fatty-acyl-CoA synthase